MIQTIRIYCQDRGIENRVEECAMFIMKSRKGQITEGSEQPNQEKIRML